MNDPIIPQGFKPASQAPAAPAAPAEPVAPAPDPTPAAPAPEPAPAPTPPAAPVAPAATVPDSPAAPPAPNPFEVASAGRVKSAEEFQAFLDKAAALEQKAQELEGKLALDPFGGNEYAKKVAELAKNGATPEELANFAKMQTLDLGKLDPLQAVRMAVQSDNPSWDAAMVDAYMANNLNLKAYVEGDGSDASPLDRVALSTAYRSAVDALGKMKVAAATPPSVEGQLAQQQAAAARLQSVSTVVQSVAGSLKSLKIGEGESGFEFPVDATILNNVLPVIAKQLADANVPIDPNLAVTADQQLRQIVWATQGEKILTAAIKNAESRTREKVVLEMSGQQPKSPSGQQPVGDPKAAKTRPDPMKLIFQAGTQPVL